jgi:acyl-CoA dehydrogenase
MNLLNPKNYGWETLDPESRELMLATIDFFERKGKAKLREDDRDRIWYADFLAFVKEHKAFATLMTPAGYGGDDARWDTWRNCAFNEILGFYGLPYWYTWQVTMLGLGPIWMGDNEAVKERTARLLQEGGIFAFGLSEQEHGADIYATDMVLTPRPEDEEGGGYLANGSKYYIGNANEAAIGSTFGRTADSDEYVFFAADPRHPQYELVKNIVNSQSYVAEYALHDYPVEEKDILARGRRAWDNALNTINVCKYNLGWASIGISTHAFYEAINHASNRHLYHMTVTDFPHVQQLFTDAYARLAAMKLFAMRASDYMRSASDDDRRYLLYNPMVKMKVTTEGERVINELWDVIAAKGFEKDMFFEMAARDIRALPKLEGTVHVNIALLVKFMPNYFFNPAKYPPLPLRSDTADDAYLFHQAPARGLGKIRFHDYNLAYEGVDLPNVRILREQIDSFKQLLAIAAPTAEQQKDIDLLLAVGELFALVVYGQLILEAAPIHGVDDDLIDQIFDFMVRDFSAHALELYSKPSVTDAQSALCLQMIKRPAVDRERFQRVWRTVHGLDGQYEMNA